MQLLLNGQVIKNLKPCSLTEFLQQQTQLPEQFAIACNGAFVAQGNYDQTLLSDGDDLELLVPMQGG
ncbi:MAG TPA: thiamine biosynthesis protein ThiS [Oceanospirillaceae bacterium]|nr:thiamine biosynthesis protein ThiS [Oceanospirillaceae bacterium]